MTKVCCIDSRSHIVHDMYDDRKEIFHAPFGASISIDNYEDFSMHYNSAFDKLLKSDGITRKRRVYASSNLKALCSDPLDYEELLEKLCKIFAEKISQIGIYYTYFHGGKPDNVVMYGKDPPYVRVERKVFLRKLQWSYPHLCAWSYIFNQDGKHKIIMDHFGGQLTEAWRQIRENDIRLIYRGDEVHAGLSATDLLIDFIQLQLKKQRKKLFEQDIIDVLSDLFERNQIKVYFLGQKYLKYISPISRYSIRTERFLHHPIIFLVKDPQVPTKSVEDSEIMNGICSYATNIGGSVKFLESGKDESLFQDDSILLALGEEGLVIAKKVKKIAETVCKDVKILAFSGGSLVEQ